MRLPVSRLGFSAALLLGIFTVTSLHLTAAAAAAPNWDAFVGKFLDDYFTAHPTEGVSAGRHEFDGLLPDWSEAGLKKEIARLEEMRRQAESFPASTLDPHQQFERDYLVMQVRKDLFWLKTADWPHRNPQYYADAIDPDTYLSRPYAPLPVRLKAFIRYAHAVPVAIAQIQENLKGPVAKPLLAIGRMTIGGLADFYEQEVPAIFASVADPAAQADLKAAIAVATKSVRAFEAWLGDREKTADNNFALGAEKFQAMMRETEGVDISVAELEAIGRMDLDRNLRALKEACAQYAPGKSVDEAVALAFSHKPDGTVVSYATKQLTDLRQFIIEHDIVSIPGTETASVGEAPSYRRWNFAYITIPGPYEKGLPSIYYVAPPDPTWPAAKQAAYVPGVGPLLFTSAHEVWPGHFLQFLHANRSPSKFGQVFVGYAFAEGWAHYCEEMMWESGLGHQSPEMHIGQLEEALLRNVRLISAIGLHTQGMTVEESVKLFREQGLQDEANAEQQARRGTFDPAYINYTMGKLMIRQLREDWTATRGGRTAWKAFHDAFLQYGGPPIPLVRKAMLGPDDHGSLFPR